MASEEPINQGAPGSAPSEFDYASSGSGESPLGAQAGTEFTEHPELLVGAAFVGGFALAKILKRLGP